MGDATPAARLSQLRDRYDLQVGPLLLLIGVGAASAPVLAWMAGALLALVTINRPTGGRPSH